MELIVIIISQPKNHNSRARILARVMRAVLSGDRQAIAVTPTDEDITAAQALLELAGRTDHNHASQGRRALSLFYRTNVRKFPNHGAISREQERGGKN